MNNIALLVLLDAFRPDYLARTEFLRDLARRGGVGAMEEPFGFLPRAAYFGGLTPNDTGYSNIFAREPWRSPFPCVPGCARLRALAGDDAIRSRVAAEARDRLPDFGGRYADGFALPLQDLASYAIAESQPPWGPQSGYRSLFDILDQAGLRWVQCSWPYTRVVAAADRGIVSTFLDQLGDDTRFGFVHLSNLDAIGHEHGPGSVAMQDALGEIDKACALLHARAHERFDRVRILFFGDHGMVTVVQTVDLRGELRQAGFEPGGQFDMFLDSPMARFWFESRRVRDGLERCLSRLTYGRVLDHDQLARYDAERMQPGNGELFFVANPGVVFSPNAFQGEDTRVLGMHGYLPDVADNRGLLLSYDSTDRTAGTLGIARATQLFPTCLQMCGLDPSAHTSTPPLRVTPERWRWTRSGNPLHEERVRADLELATATLAARAPASAIVVTGSFGRGEGGVVDGPDGIRALNDYDFAVIGSDAEAAAGLGPPLAAALGTDFCDVMPFLSAAALPPSQFHFDLRYGSRVVAGDARVLDRLPPYAPAEITVGDAALLLMNRVAGIMLVPLPEQRGEIAPLTQFALNQLTKALIAVGDAYLIAIGDYSPRYRDRAQRFAALSASLPLEPRSARRVEAAYRFKLGSGDQPDRFAADDFAQARPAISSALRFVASVETSRVHSSAVDADGWSMAAAAALAPVQDAAADQEQAVRRLRQSGFAPTGEGQTGDRSIRRAILEGMAALFRATLRSDVNATDWDTVRDRLGMLGFRAAAGAAGVAADPETARGALAAAWLTVCH